MGCSSSKKEVQQKPSPQLDSPGANEEPVWDARCPLTKRQLFSISKSYKAIKREMEKTGVEMILHLFKNHPEYKDIFTNIPEEDEENNEKLLESPELENFSDLFLGNLERIVECLPEYDAYIEKIKEFSTSLKKSKITSENFNTLKTSMIYAIKQTLGDRYTENMENIYNIIINAIFDETAKVI